MIPAHVYSVTPQKLAARYDAILEQCRRQGIGELTILASITGKLLAAPEELRDLRRRLEKDGLAASAMIFAVGHPQMDRFYEPDGSVHRQQWYDGPLVFRPSEDAPDPAAQMAAPIRQQIDLMPRGWQYAVNEFGQNVYCSACPNEAWRSGNLAVIRELAGVFDEVWYDDEYRVDSDQFAGVKNKSTASCYCAKCLEAVSKRVGRRVTTADVLADQKIHEAWIAHKVECLSSAWSLLVDAGREVNPKLAVGLMIRWGGEERDGLDVAPIVSKMGEKLLLRVGEGHFGVDAYALPESQVIEYLVAGYHVSWYPQAAVVKSETTYFAPVPRAWVVKKAALALAAGARQLSYCPCLPEWIEHQSYIAEDRHNLEQWGDALGDKSRMFGEIQIVRGRAAATGDRRPTQRVRDRQAFPLFGLAGLCSAVVRIGSWRHDRQATLAAITGRAVWDYPATDWAGHKYVVLDGAALLENAPVNATLGIGQARQESDGLVAFNAAGWTADGRLLRKGNIILIPAIWQDIPAKELPAWLTDIRRVLAPLMPSFTVEGALNVIPIHYRHNDQEDIVMVVNLLREPQKVQLCLRLADTGSPAKKMTVRMAELPGDGIEVMTIRRPQI